MQTLITNLKELKVETNFPGFADFFYDVIADLAECVFGSLIIDDKMSECEGGTFSNSMAVDCITMPLRDVAYNAETNTISFSEEGMLTFVHEASHFRHLTVDHGTYMCPMYNNRAPASIAMLKNDKDGSFRYACEYEAGYRCAVAEVMYDIFGNTLLVADNLRNLICYRKSAYPWYKEQADYLQDGHKDKLSELSAFVLNVCERFMNDKKFSDIIQIDNVDIELTDNERIRLQSLMQ